MARKKKTKPLLRGQLLLRPPAPPEGFTASMKAFMVPYAIGYVQVRRNPRLDPNGIRGGFRPRLYAAFETEFRVPRLIDEEERQWKLRVRRRRRALIWAGLLWAVDMLRFRSTRGGMWRAVDIFDLDMHPRPAGAPRPIPVPAHGVRAVVRARPPVMVPPSPLRRRSLSPKIPSPTPSLSALLLRSPSGSDFTRSPPKRLPASPLSRRGTPTKFVKQESASPSKFVKQESASPSALALLLRSSRKRARTGPIKKEAFMERLPPSPLKQRAASLSPLPPSELSSPISYPSSPEPPSPSPSPVSHASRGGFPDFSCVRVEDRSAVYQRYLATQNLTRGEDAMIRDMICNGFQRRMTPPPRRVVEEDDADNFPYGAEF